MTDAHARASTRNSKFIKAPPDALYRAFTDPAALAVWQAPGDMTGAVHNFDYRVGGGYQMSLYYPASDTTARGKTADREDLYTARFVELTPPSRIVEAITFDSSDPAFIGEMIMTVTLEAADGGTTVSIVFTDIPPGVRPQDNEAGTRLTLEKLARYVEVREEVRMADEFRALGQQVLDAQPFSVLLGTRLLAFAPGQVTMTLTVKAEHRQEHGSVHGGVISYLADTAMRFAGGSALGIEVLTAEVKINYVRPAQGAELVVRASAVATAGQQAVCRAEVWAVAPGADDVPVAFAQGTVVGRAALGA